ncbi:unnamed protein product [Ambrosiozyma monospora]|uniref:Unnamed protein product n=1 Tax=Ambrosiozyma monospora TaxID=43982 RepID=A0ACB5T405_AMBMO|nr:unnamed protein product [Ambrosiozyma monospora]
MPPKSRTNKKNKIKQNRKANAQKKVAQEKARRAEELPQLEWNKFIEVTSTLPTEIQDIIMAHCLDFAHLKENYEQFADVIKTMPLKSGVDLHVDCSLNDGWSIQLRLGYIECKENMDETEFKKYIDQIKVLGAHELYVSSDVPSGVWCDLIPYARIFGLDNFESLSASWSKQYADKVTDVTVGAEPE